jgi:hypothetical protein
MQCTTAQNQKKGAQTPSSKCIDCPLCTVLMQAPLQTFKCIVAFTTFEYTIAITNNLSDYFTRQWKPPNHSLLS